MSKKLSDQSIIEFKWDEYKTEYLGKYCKVQGDRGKTNVMSGVLIEQDYTEYLSSTPNSGNRVVKTTVFRFENSGCLAVQKVCTNG